MEAFEVLDQWTYYSWKPLHELFKSGAAKAVPEIAPTVKEATQQIVGQSSEVIISTLPQAEIKDIVPPSSSRYIYIGVGIISVSYLLYRRKSHRKYIKLDKSTIIILSRNGAFGRAVGDCINKLSSMQSLNLKVKNKVITASVSSTYSDEDFSKARFVILVAISEPRMLFFSDSEESQLGNIYKRATDMGCTVFLVIAGHQDSESLQDNEAYSKASLDEVIRRQPVLTELRNKNKLISVGCAYQPENISFNTKQTQLIVYWLKQAD